jgi:hypothetical protein
MKPQNTWVDCTTLHPIGGLLQHVHQAFLPRAHLGRMHVLPPRRQRQTHKNALHPRARRVQAKTRASVVHEVEFHVASAAQLLPCLFVLRVGHVFALLNEGQVAGQEGVEAVLHEAEEGFLVVFLGVEVVEEDSADAARFLPVGNVKVFVAPFFEAWVVVFVVLVAGLFDALVEVYRVFVKEVRGRQVSTAAEPPCFALAGGVHGFEIPVVEMHSGGHGVHRVQHETEACGEEFQRIDAWVIEGFVVYTHLLYGSTGEGAVDDACVDAGFFEYLAVLEHAGYTVATGGAVPRVDAEFLSVFERFERGDDFFLLFFDKVFHAEAHRGGDGDPGFAFATGVLVCD